MSVGDHLCLFALAHCFAVRVVVITSLDSPQFITEVRPRLMRRKKPVILGHWAEFGYATLQPVSLLSLCHSSSRVSDASLFAVVRANSLQASLLRPARGPHIQRRQHEPRRVSIRAPLTV